MKETIGKVASEKDEDEKAMWLGERAMSFGDK